MELRHLRYFVVAAEEEHFHRAAKRLNIVQPALSRQIRVLEREVGVVLFDRLRHGVRLSSAGRVFLEGARRILAESDALIHQAQRAEKGQLGLLRIGIAEAGASCPLVPQAFNAFRRDFPEVELALTPGTSHTQLGRLREGKTDAAFFFDMPEGDETISQVKIRSMERYLLLPRGHKLAKKRELKLADLNDQSFIFRERAIAPAGYDRMMARFLAGGLSPRIVQFVTNEETIIHLVAVGMGVSFTLVPDAAYLPKDVTVRRVSDYTARLELGLVWLRSNKSPALMRFVDTVRTLVKNTKGG